MFNHPSGEARAFNWRGPLTAAVIFAAVFAILLLMAHQNEAATSDMGSSLREDPYGASLLFDAYERAGYQIKRSQDEDSLSDENALRTTAFFIGGHPFNDWKMEGGKLQIGDNFLGRVERFLARGGRVVLVAPAWKLKSKAQDWEVEREWNKAPDKSGPIWVSPDLGQMPGGIEKMYLASNSPWLKTDPAWSPLYSRPLQAEAKANAPARVYMAMRRVGNGELIAASQESFLLNEAVKTSPNPGLLDFLAAGRPVVWVDETLHGLNQSHGVLWLVERYRLQAALLLFWASFVTLLWSLSGDLVRRPARDQKIEIVRHSEGAEVAARRLLQRSIAKHKVVAECWEEFRGRSPQDAEAISEDPDSGMRLRAALAEPPLTGYTELSLLIQQRRGSEKGLACAQKNASDGSTSSPARGVEEARF